MRRELALAALLAMGCKPGEDPSQHAKHADAAISTPRPDLKKGERSAMSYPLQDAPEEKQPPKPEKTTEELRIELKEQVQDLRERFREMRKRVRETDLESGDWQAFDTETLGTGELYNKLLRRETTEKGRKAVEKDTFLHETLNLLNRAFSLSQRHEENILKKNTGKRSERNMPQE